MKPKYRRGHSCEGMGTHSFTVLTTFNVKCAITTSPTILKKSRGNDYEKFFELTRKYKQLFVPCWWAI